MSDKKAKVTGVGGIFFKCEDPNQLKQWYAEQLGFDTDEYGTTFTTKQKEDPNQNAYLQWSTFSKNTEQMLPSTKDFMINYRVDNLELLVEQLKKAGVTILDNIVSYDYGKFVHIMDPEGNKIELWEPVDAVFDQYYEDQKNK